MVNEPCQNGLGPRRLATSFRYVTVAVLCCLGIALSVGAFGFTRDGERRRESDQFEAAARDRVAAIREQLDAHALILESLHALYAANADEEISRREFRTFCTPLLARHHDIQALEWIPRVPSGKRRDCEAAARADGLEAFQITENTSRGDLIPAAQREEYFPVYFAEPRKGNEKAIGFDLASDPMRLEALSRSRDTGQMVATVPITLVQETEHQVGFLVFVPVYDSNATVETVGQRRDHLKGFILGVMRAGDLVKGALANLVPAGIDMDLCDNTESPQTHLLYYHVSRASVRLANEPRYARVTRADGLTYQETLHLAGRKWSVVCAATPTFLAAHTTIYPWGVLGAGLMFTLLASAYLASTTRQAVRQHQLVRQLSGSNQALGKEVSERKRAEETLRTSQARFSQVADNSGEWIWEVDGEGLYTYSSPAVESILGFTSEDVVGKKHFYDFFAPQVRDELLKFAADAMARKVPFKSWNNMNVHRNGRIVYLETSGVPVLDEKGNVLGYRGVDVDITERKRAEDTIRQSEERFRVLFESSHDAMMTLEPPLWKFTSANPATVAMFRAKNVAEFTSNGPADLSPERQPDGRASAEKAKEMNDTVIREGSRFFEWTHKRIDGEEFSATVLLTRMECAGKTVIQSTVRDITEQKRAENAIHQAKAEAEQANAAKSTFLANMSHEIRTPMTAILGFAEMIGASIECCTTCAQHEACPTREQNRENIQVIQRNGEHLLTLINDILDLSKVEAGKIDLECAPCSPVQLVEETASLMGVRAAEKSLFLQVRYEFPLPQTVLTDPARVRQVLMNLVSNAVKFTAKGRVTIVARCVGEPRDGRAMLAFDVRDTGIGMTPEQVARLFQPFVQADSSTTRQFGGTGLGLAISKRLANALGGDIQVASRPGEGSTFTFTMTAQLPESTRILRDISEIAACSHAQSRSPAAAAATLHGRILLAEDGLDNQKLISMILRKAGAEVDVAPNGRIAVEKALAASSAGAPYDAILMDMQMPEMDGYEATRKLRQSKCDKPIVALTAHAMTEDRQKCLDAGCDDYATKPLDRPALLATLARLMGAGQPQPPAEPVPTPSDAPIASAFGGDPDMAEIIAQFVAQLPQCVMDLRLAATNSQWELVQRLAHQVKGAGGSYGYACLTHAARELETHAKQKDAEAVMLALNAMARLSQRILAGHAPIAAPNM